jgi:hypothetical protein
MSKYISLAIDTIEYSIGLNYLLCTPKLSYLGTWWQRVTLITDTQSNDGARSQYKLVAPGRYSGWSGSSQTRVPTITILGKGH